MSLSIMRLLIASSSQFAAHPHHHQRQPKPIHKPAAKPAPKSVSKGKHVQLFKMKCKVGKGFYSVPVDGQ